MNSGRFLDFLLIQRGIEENLEKIKAILKNELPWYEKVIFNY